MFEVWRVDDGVPRRLWWSRGTGHWYQRAEARPDSHGTWERLEDAMAALERDMRLPDSGTRWPNAHIEFRYPDGSVHRVRFQAGYAVTTSPGMVPGRVTFIDVVEA
jgi:hypothetical protein